MKNATSFAVAWDAWRATRGGLTSIPARHVQVRVKACHAHGLAEPITDPTRIADFLELRLQRHPTMNGAILKSEWLPAQPSRAELEAYARKLAMVIIRPEKACATQ